MKEYKETEIENHLNQMMRISKQADTPQKYAHLLRIAGGIVRQIQKDNKRLTEEKEWTEAAMAAGIRAAMQDNLCSACTNNSTLELCRLYGGQCRRCRPEDCHCAGCECGSNFGWAGPDF